MISNRRPTSSALFPYTTLFRSGCPRCRHTKDGTEGNARCKARREGCEEGSRSSEEGSDCPKARGKEACCKEEDRKSTRLNSSHVRISYAVFCLKKKKKTRTQ